MKTKLEPSFVTDKEAVLPRGRYFITDPCYLFGDEYLWNKICDAFQKMEDTEERHQINMKLGDQDVFMWTTAYGDGSYPVYQGKMFIGEASVDSGTLSMIPEKIVKEMIDQSRVEDFEKVGVWVETRDSLYPINEGGNLSIDDIEVITADNKAVEDDEDDAEDEEDYYDDDFYSYNDIDEPDEDSDEDKE